MRLSDLITFVRLTTEPYDDRLLPDEERLTVIKAAFPRQDLLGWFDARQSPALPGPYYFPVLIIQVAAQIGIRSAQVFGVFCDAQREISLVDEYFEHPPESLVRWEIGQFGRVVDAQIPPLHQVGQVSGFFSAEQEITALDQCLNTNFYHSQRLLFLSQEVFDRVNRSTMVPPTAHEGFRAMLQNWNGQKLYLLYLANVAVRKLLA
jgi:hypothetical protein